MKAICINFDYYDDIPYYSGDIPYYYDDIDVQSVVDFDKTQKQYEDYVFGILICENSENDSCFCGEENSKIYFETPKATITDIDSDVPLCNRSLYCAGGLVEYRFETSNLQYEEDCDENILTLCSFDLDPMSLTSEDSGWGFEVLELNQSASMQKPILRKEYQIIV